MLPTSANYRQPMPAAGPGTVADSQTFSDSYLLDFIKAEIDANPNYADQLIDVLNRDQLLRCESRDLISQRMGSILNVAATRNAALKIAYYVAGTIQEGLHPLMRQRSPAHYFSKSAELGYMPALKPLSTCYLRGESLTCNGEPSFLAKEILHAASTGNQESCVHNDDDAINAFLNEQFEKKHPQATYQLAMLHQQLGDYETAYEYLENASLHNCPDATVELGKIHFYEIDAYRFTKSKKHGEYLLQKAAIEFGSMRAKKILNEIYRNGEGQGAFRYFSEGLTNNDPDLIIGLSKLYEKGIGGVIQDATKAQELLIAASEGGSAEASFLLAKAAMEKHGDTINSFPKKEKFDQHEAYPHLLKAAQEHHREAALAVGIAHLLRVWRGNSGDETIAKSITLAEKYLTLTAGMGDKKAQKALFDLRRLKKKT